MHGFWLAFTLIYMLVLAPIGFGLVLWKVPAYAKLITKGRASYTKAGVYLGIPALLLYLAILTIGAWFVPF